MKKIISRLLAVVRPGAKKPPKARAAANPLAPATIVQQRGDADTEPPQACATLARSPRILDEFGEALALAGCAGEDRTAKLVYLALTSRLFSRPVSIAVKGPSSAGKSFTVEKVLEFFPQTAFYALTAMSERALAYSKEPLKHRFLVFFEAAGMKGETASYLVRSLLSEGRVRYETVEKTSNGMRTRCIDRPGPTGLITTTTLVGLHPENETRLLSVHINDSQERTREVMMAMAEERGAGADFAPWHSLQEWLATGEHRVFLPYARRLAELVPPVAVRLRRDFKALLTLIESHALLHRARRERDGQGRIVATVDDYAAVRELVADIVSQGVKASVSKTIRETVEAVGALVQDSPEGVSITKLAEVLHLDKSAVSRRVQSAITDHYLINLEEQKGKPARVILGEALPQDVEILPPPDALPDCCTVAA